MATQYRCGGDQRRDLVRAARDGGGQPLLNGIDYLEVGPDQTTLDVVFIHPLPGEADGVPGGAAPALTRENFRLTGGVRITGIRIDSASSAERTVTLEVDRPGDFSLYDLKLVASVTESEPPAGFDPQLAEVRFSFKIDCPTSLDCAPNDECAPEPRDEPLIDYLAKDYSSFRRLMLDRLSVVIPQWTERNPADVGVTLVELLAEAADRLSYYQDAVATEAYLGTARKRVSVRRHARLLDYPMHDGSNARAWVCLEVDGSGTGIALTPEGAGGNRRTRFLTRCVDQAVVNPTDLEDVLGRFAPTVFEPLHPATLYAAHNRIDLYTWGATECCLPRGATRATLLDDAAGRLLLRPGDVVIFEEVVHPTQPGADPDPSHRHAVRLTHVHPEATLDPTAVDPRAPGPAAIDPLTGELYVEIEWERTDDLPFPICISTIRDGVPISKVSVVRGNVVLADHGRTFAEEPLRIEQRANFATARLSRPEITRRVPFEPDAAARWPAAATITQEPRAARAAVSLRTDDAPEEIWAPSRDLLDSDEFGREMVVEMESDGTAQLRFGDGLLGRRPDGEFLATYRVGSGSEGNVGADSITHVVTDVAAIQRVWNPLPAIGGTEPEPLEQVRLYAPQAFRTQERAVTEEDYAAVARRHPDVQHAHATLRWTGSWHTMFVTVDRFGGRPVDDEFEELLRGFIARFQLAGHDVEIEPPRFVPLDIAFTVCVHADHFPATVRAELIDLFSTRDLGGGRRGFFHPDNLTFGQPLYLSQLVAAAMGVPGVRSVDVDDTAPKPNRFRRWGESAHGEIDAGVIEVGRLEIIRVDNDPNAMENGRIQFFLEGGR